LPSDRQIYAGIRTHGDAIADAGFMYRSERERLHTLLAAAS
jgi:hypothetical protein